MKKNLAAKMWQWGSIPAFLLLAIAGCQSEQPPGQGQNQPPVASFTATPQSGTAPLQVSFDGSASFDPDGTIASYAWSFGDGNTASGVVTSHTFTNAGEITVRLTVTDNRGATDAAERVVEVLDDPGDPGDPGDPDDPADPIDPPTDDAFKAAGVTVPTVQESTQQTATAVGLDAVVTATQLSGSVALVTTGTLTQDAGGNFSYSSSPNDRLRIAFHNGSRVDYFIANLDGDFQASSVEEFLRRPHVFIFRVVSEGIDLEVSLQRDESAYLNNVSGRLTADGVLFNLDIAKQGTYTASVGSALDYRTQDQVQGTITSTGFSAIIDESSTYRLFAFENFIEISTRTINNSWNVGADQYALVSGFIRRDFKNAKPSELDNWRAEGVLTRNGVQIGGIGAENTGFGIDIFVQANGDKTVLYSDLF